RNTTTDMVVETTAPVNVPGVRLPGFPGGIADEPSGITQVGLEHQHASFAQRHVRYSRLPIRLRGTVIFHVDRQHMCARLEEGCEIEVVIVQSPGLATDRAAKALVAVDKERIARVSGDAGRRTARDVIEVDCFAEETMGLFGWRFDTSRKGAAPCYRLL